MFKFTASSILECLLSLARGPLPPMVVPLLLYSHSPFNVLCLPVPEDLFDQGQNGCARRKQRDAGQMPASHVATGCRLS